MSTALALINAMVSLMAMADKLGLNVDAVKAKFDQAKAEGRDVTDAEVHEMAAAAQASGDKLDELIKQLPE